MALRLTEKQYRQLVGVPTSGLDNAEEKKKSKYGNKKTVYDGKKFDSEKERDRYIELYYLNRAGLIADLKCQVKFKLLDAVRLSGESRLKRETNYIADFTYIDLKTKKLVVEDVKSKATRKIQTYRLKKTMMKLKFNIDVIEILY